MTFEENYIYECPRLNKNTLWGTTLSDNWTNRITYLGISVDPSELLTVDSRRICESESNNNKSVPMLSQY